MKHADTAALARLGPLLGELRALLGLREKQPGIFYRGSRAWLHFHEDGALLWADLKQDRVWLRLPASLAEEQHALTARVRSSQASD